MDAPAKADVAIARWTPGVGTVPGSYVFVAELDPAGLLPFPSSRSATVTIG